MLPFQFVPANYCDISNAYNYSVPNDVVGMWKSASGSLSFNENHAIMGAIGESLERYSGAIYDFEIKRIDELKDESALGYAEFSLFSDDQYSNPDFVWERPNDESQYYGKVFSLYDNSEYYVPHELIGLGSKTEAPCFPSTSTGIAAHTDKYQALYSALLEVLERDALTAYWLNSIGGREINLSENYLKEVRDKNGQIYCFDITQDWNPFPVVIICGYLLSNNKKRISMGVACRETYEKAIEKAYCEWIQGCIFAGFYLDYHTDLKLADTRVVNNFDLHAVYYTCHPDQWLETPLLKNRTPYKNTKINVNLGDERAETKTSILLQHLCKEGIRLFYRNLTTIDVMDIGVTVVRVLSPELSLIHGDENMPFLGGNANNVAWRYKGLKSGGFPNRFPHPLG